MVHNNPRSMSKDKDISKIEVRLRMTVCPFIMELLKRRNLEHWPSPNCTSHPSHGASPWSLHILGKSSSTDRWTCPAGLSPLPELSEDCGDKVVFVSHGDSFICSTQKVNARPTFHLQTCLINEWLSRTHDRAQDSKQQWWLSCWACEFQACH